MALRRSAEGAALPEGLHRTLEPVVSTAGASRLIVVASADPDRRYAWMPRPRAGDVVVALDPLAHADLTELDPVLFDRLETWEQRSAAEHLITELLLAIRTHPGVAAEEPAGYSLIEFAEFRLRLEVARLLRGWTLARAAPGARELACDPATAPALRMGVRAGLGLDVKLVHYTVPPALPGSRAKRAVARPLMRALGVLSRPERMRVAAVATGKLALALASLPAADLRAAAVGVMPFPGLDHGNSALLSLRRRLPLLPTYGSGPRVGGVVRFPERLGLVNAAPLDRALSLLVGRMLAGVAGELECAVGALAGLRGARSLRAIVLPSAAYGASRLLIEWAHERGIRVAAMQHGIYVFREFDGGDRRADVVFGWGVGISDQVRAWPAPKPSIVAVGVPGSTSVRRPARTGTLHNVLIATTNSLDMPIMPTGFCDSFINVLAPGLRRIAATGVCFSLRPHPNEDPERYRRLLRANRLEVEVSTELPFSEAVADADLLISSASSVAFEAAALGVPVLLWLGIAPQWVRREHLVDPWVQISPGTFESIEDFDLLVTQLLERPGEAFAIAHELSRRLARYAEPFEAARFAAGLRELSV